MRTQEFPVSECCRADTDNNVCPSCNSECNVIMEQSPLYTAQVWPEGFIVYEGNKEFHRSPAKAAGRSIEEWEAAEKEHSLMATKYIDAMNTYESLTGGI